MNAEIAHKYTDELRSIAVRKPGNCPNQRKITGKKLLNLL